MGDELNVFMIESDLPDFLYLVANEPSVEEKVANKFSTVEEDIRGGMGIMLVVIRYFPFP